MSKSLIDFSDVKAEFELAEWEKPYVPQTTEEIEFHHVLEQIQAIRSGAKTPEELLPAFDLQWEWLEKHPKDMAMLRVGSCLVRSVEWRGGNWEEFSQLLQQRRVEHRKAA
jgi:hypothetical protein